MWNEIRQTWWFFLLLVVPATYGVDFDYGKLTILSNAMSILVRLKVWDRPEQLTTACAFAVWLIMVYWTSVLFGVYFLLHSDTSVLWTGRNLFIHLMLPLDSVFVCAECAAFSRRRGSMMLTAWIAGVYGVASSFLEPPPYAYQENIPTVYRLVGSFFTVLALVLLQWALHVVTPRVYTLLQKRC